MIHVEFSGFYHLKFNVANVIKLNLKQSWPAAFPQIGVWGSQGLPAGASHFYSFAWMSSHSAFVSRAST